MIIATDPEPLSGSYYVRYYPALQQFFGSKQVPLIIDRLEYWFHNKKFKGGFFKFLEPCSHYLYKPGDSWEEEVGICRKAFNAAFNLIGVSYESKTAYMAETDPFKGKLYARYYDRKANQMFFVRNHAFAEEFFKSLFKRKAKLTVPKTTEDQAAINDQKDRKKEGQKGRSWSGRNDRSCGGAYIDKQITTNNSSLESDPQPMPEEVVVDKKPEEEMKKVWMEEIGAVPSISPHLAFQMRNILQQQFADSLDCWRNYCKKIASSKFLMGEVPNTRFKAWLSWAVKPDAIERIEAGGFTFGDREQLVQGQGPDFQRLAEGNICQQPTVEAQAFHRYVLAEIGAGKYYHWFRQVSIEQTDAQEVRIMVPRLLEKSYLEQHYATLIQTAVDVAFKRPCTYQLVVKAAVES
jgi:hypothetical protein